MGLPCPKLHHLVTKGVIRRIYQSINRPLISTPHKKTETTLIPIIITKDNLFRNRTRTPCHQYQESTCFRENSNSQTFATCTVRRRNRKDAQKMPIFVFIISICFVLCDFVNVTATGIACNVTDDCTRAIRRNSRCLPTGFCSNPFHHGGCLTQMLNSSFNTQINNSASKIGTISGKALNSYRRVCSSSDLPDSATTGVCVPANKLDFVYPEIRLLGLNWESVFFETWIVQILLSEILGVPTSVETSFPDKAIDFYDIHSRFDYGKPYDYDAFRIASELGDCRDVVQPQNSSQYVSCAQVGLEFWEGQKANLKEVEDEGVIEKPSALGALGYAGWYLPKFTAERDPTLLNYLGLSGEDNRQKLARSFLRPTKWIDYCTQVSINNCTTPDSVAQRAPLSAAEESRMFFEGTYTGFFRNTTENDCEANPTTCTGHIADLPCGWTSFVKQQTHHLKIALESNGDEPKSGGYTYTQLTDIWAAANATKSNVLMMWWTPEPLVQQYIGTEAEFLRVLLPPTTQECVDNRVNPNDRCSGIPEKEYGNAKGACDDEPHPLMKVLIDNLFEITYDPTISEAERSPAYDALRNFEIATLQLGVIFEKWFSKNTDHWGYDPREAVCEWVVENLDTMKSFIPRTYPRTLEGVSSFRQPIFYIAIVFGSFSMMLLLATSFAIYRYRKRKVIVIAQIEFLALLLLGLILTQISALVLAASPSNLTCTLIAWFRNVGYTLELVPLLVKVAAINRLVAAASRMKRVRIDRKRLFVIVAGLTLLTIVYLIIWTVLSPPRKYTEFEVSDTTNAQGGIVVRSYDYCSSESSFWNLIALGWRSILLFSATILAFQSRNSPVNVNESRTLALMVYSKFVFLLLTFIVFALSHLVHALQLQEYESLIQSLDVACVCCIYFIPKLTVSDEVMAKASLMHRTSMVSNNNTTTPWMSGTQVDNYRVQFRERSYSDGVTPKATALPSDVRDTKVHSETQASATMASVRNAKIAPVKESSEFEENFRILVDAAKKRKKKEMMHEAKSKSMPLIRSNPSTQTRKADQFASLRNLGRLIGTNTLTTQASMPTLRHQISVPSFPQDNPVSLNAESVVPPKTGGLEGNESITINFIAEESPNLFRTLESISEFESSLKLEVVPEKETVP